MGLKCVILHCKNERHIGHTFCDVHAVEWTSSPEYKRGGWSDASGVWDTALGDFIRRTEAEHRNYYKD